MADLAPDILAGLDAETRLVVRELACWSDETIPYAREVACDLDMPVEKLRQILRRLTAGGFVTYGPLFRQEDGMPLGSSYWLTEQGVALQNLVKAIR